MATPWVLKNVVFALNGQCNRWLWRDFVFPNMLFVVIPIRFSNGLIAQLNSAHGNAMGLKGRHVHPKQNRLKSVDPENQHLFYSKIEKFIYFYTLENIYTMETICFYKVFTKQLDMSYPEKYFFQKAGELYRKYGVKSVTMDDVSRELGISKKTLYTHVKDKKELIERVLDFEFHENMESFSIILHKGGNAIEELFAVHSFMKTLLKYHSPAFDYDLKKYYPDIFLTLVSRKREAMYRSVLDNINRGKKEGFYRKELKGELISKLYVVRMENAQEGNVLSLDDFLLPEVFHEYFIYHIRGIANKKGVEFLEQNMNKLDYNVVKN